MEDWSKDFFTALETGANELERLFTDIGQEVVEVVDTFTKLSEEFAEQVRNTILVEVDRQLNELAGPIFELYFGLEPGFDDELGPVFYHVEPIAHPQPACAGCRHYHGQVYGGHPFVCAMHPYGWEAESCPDWEAGGWH